MKKLCAALAIALLPAFTSADEITIGGHSLLLEWYTPPDSQMEIPAVKTPDGEWLCLDCIDFKSQPSGRPAVKEMKLDTFSFIKRDDRNKNRVWTMHVAPVGKHLDTATLSGEYPTAHVSANEVNCKTGETRTTVSVFYAGYLKRTKTLRTFNEPSPWQPAIPGTYAELYVSLVCGAPKK